MQEEIYPMAGMKGKNSKGQVASGKCRKLVRKAEFLRSAYKNKGASLGLSCIGLEKVLLTHCFQIHSLLVYCFALVVGFTPCEKETR